VLIVSMVAFTLANIVAFDAKGYWTLMGARVLLAFSAGSYVPNANALASALVPHERRGAALAIVNGGTTVALVFGVPLGAIVGNQLGWRMTFGGVAVLSVIATIGLLAGLPHNIGRHMAVVTLHERIAVAVRPAVLLIMLITMLWATGAFTIYTYLAPYLNAAIGIDGAKISLVLFMWGIAAAIGVFAGGALCDKIGSSLMVVATLLILTITFASLSVSAWFLTPAMAVIPVLIAIGVWGVTAWAFYPSQLARLIGIAGPGLAPVALSLNASFINFGLSLGALLGSFTLAQGGAADLGWVGAVCELAAVALMPMSLRRVRFRWPELR
jgi:predicted MFS family arabinose efflux permease